MALQRDFVRFFFQTMSHSSRSDGSLTCLSPFESEYTENVEGLSSVSGILSSALVSILSLPTGAANMDENETSPLSTSNSVRNRGYDCIDHDDVTTDPIDISWLQDRCENDDELIFAVLRSFCEQGQDHIASLSTIYHSESAVETKIREILFLSVLHFAHKYMFLLYQIIVCVM